MRSIRTLAAAAVAVVAGVAASSPSVGGAQGAPSGTGRDIRIAAAATTTRTYSDSFRSQQWAMDRMSGEALRARRQARGIVVAVIDSGVQANHPDLKGRVLTGWDFLANKPGGTVDGYGHGTHVAGIIAANVNNHLGVAGLAPDAMILPLRVLDDDGRGFAGTAAKALVHAADHGAKVAVVSLASDFSQKLADAVDYAQTKGVIVVAAAGNGRRAGNRTSYPAALPGVIGVAAEDSTGTVASFSNTGSYVDVAAPGVRVVSTYKDSRYVLMNGTSMATPYVAATIAVLAAARPGLTAAAALKALQSTARDMGPKGIDPMTGAGEIQPVKALCTLQRCA